MTKFHATQLLTRALQGDSENTMVNRAAGFYANVLTSLAGVVLSDHETFFDELLGEADDQDRGETMDRIGIFASRR